MSMREQCAACGRWVSDTVPGGNICWDCNEEFDNERYDSDWYDDDDCELVLDD